jgi:hypothetical protein
LLPLKKANPSAYAGEFLPAPELVAMDAKLPVVGMLRAYFVEKLWLDRVVSR